MTYIVKPGDTLSKIATRNGSTLAQLLQANPQVTDPNKSKGGDVINLPEDSTGVPAGSTAAPKPLPGNVPTAATAASYTSTESTSSAAGALGTAIAFELGIL